MSLDVQFMTMLVMIVGGIYLGLAKDTLRRFAPLWDSSVFLKYGIEISFWFMQTVILYYVLFLVNAGELRLILFVALFLGFSMYQALFSRVYVKILELFIRIGKRVFLKIKQIVIFLFIRPVQFLFRVLKKCLWFILMGVGAVLLFLLKMVYSPVRWIGKRLYALLPSEITKFFPTQEQIYSIIKNIAHLWKKIWSYLRR